MDVLAQIYHTCVALDQVPAFALGQTTSSVASPGRNKPGFLIAHLF